MKKSALFLSALVTVSSVTPVFAMQPNQEESTFSRFVTNGFLSLRDNIKAGMKHTAKLVNDLTGGKEAVDTIVGDSKKETESVSNAFNGMAQTLRNDFRQANIPGTEKIVNDNNMSFIKLALIGLGGYMLLRILINTFPIQQAQQNNRRQARSRFATHVPGTGRGRRR